MSGARFDADYYARFYKDPDTRVAAQDDIVRLAGFVVAYAGYLELPVQRVLDMGCGLGFWRSAISQLVPDAQYTGVEVSEHICKELGFQQGSVVDYRGRGRFDLVICQGVLQYVSDGGLRKAIGNLARLTRGLLYLEVLSQEDWDHNCDQTVTDGDVHLRPAARYRELLRPHFVTLGGGVFLARTAPVTLYELEKIE